MPPFSLKIRIDRLRGLILPASYCCLVAALYLENGFYNGRSLVLLGLATGLSYYYYVRFALRRGRSQAACPAWTASNGLLLMVVAGFFILSAKRYSLDQMPFLSSRIALMLLFAAEAVFLVRSKKGDLYVLCGLVFLHNIVYSVSLGVPPIDVYHFIDQGARCILHLQNPYTHLYPQIYPAHEIGNLYGSLPAEAGGIPFQPYTPLVLLLSAPGALIGDIRIVTIAAFAATPIVIHRILRLHEPAMDARKANLIATAALFFPNQGYFLFHAWNDALPALFFALFLYCHLGKRRFLAYASLAVMIGLKQYTAFFVLPLLFLLDFKDRNPYLATLLFLAAPFAVFGFTGMHEMFGSVVLFILQLPFRPESLNLVALLANEFNVRLFSPLPYFATILSANALFLLLKRDKRADLAGAALSSFVLFSLFLLLSKQAFANYYYFLSVMLFCSLALFSKENAI
jgi:hypothetical protein